MVLVYDFFELYTSKEKSVLLGLSRSRKFSVFAKRCRLVVVLVGLGGCTFYNFSIGIESRDFG